MTTRFLGKAASSSRQAVSEPGEVPRPSDGTAPILRTALRKKTGHPKLTVGEGPSWTSGAGGCDKLAVIRSPHQLPQHQAQRRLRPPDTPGARPRTCRPSCLSRCFRVPWLRRCSSAPACEASVSRGGNSGLPPPASPRPPWSPPPARAGASLFTDGYDAPIVTDGHGDALLGTASAGS